MHNEIFNEDGLMTFGQAMIMLMKGHTISRFCLNYPTYYKIDIHIEAGEKFKIPCVFHKYKDRKAPAAFESHDLTSKDWIIYTPNQKLF